MLFTFTATSNGVLAASSALIGPASHVIWASPPPGSCALSENGNLEVPEKPVTVMFTWSYTLNLREEFVLPTVSLPSVTFNFATERFGILDSPGLIPLASCWQRHPGWRNSRFPLRPSIG